MDIVGEEIYNSFGVQRRSKVFLKKNGKTDESKIFKVTGFSTSEKEKKKELSLIQVGEQDGSYEHIKVTSKDEITVIKDKKERND